MGVTRELKVLVWDIETAPGRAYFWRPKVRFIPHSMVINPPHIICWSAKLLGDKKIHTDKMRYSEIAEGDDSRITASLAKLVRDADVIVAHNGDQFDEPFLRGRLYANNQEPLGPTDSIDTKKLAARDFDLPHNNLDALAKIGNLGSKDKTDLSWWTDIIEAPNKTAFDKAMNRMLRYNKKDVVILEKVFESLRPHVKRLKRLYDVVGVICTNCGSSDLQKRGVRKYRTQASTFQQYQCNDCGRYFRHRMKDKDYNGGGAGDLRHI